MQSAIIGAGNVGRASGSAWSSIDHQIRYGVRSRPRNTQTSAPTESAAPRMLDASRRLVVAMPWNATEPAIKSMGDLAGKIVVHCTNPLTMGSDGLGLTVGDETSGGEIVARWAASASVFKTLNQTGAENVAMARQFAQMPLMFVADGNQQRKPVVLQLVGELRFEASMRGRCGLRD